MLFDKKTKGVVKVIWGILAVIVILSMILLYIPFLTV